MFDLLVFVLAVGAGLGVFALSLRLAQRLQREHHPEARDSSIRVASLASGGEAKITMNGLTLKMKGGRLTVNGQPWGPVGEDGAVAPLPPPPKVVLNQDGTITGPVQGDLIIEGKGPVTLIVKGDVHGSINVAYGNVQCGTAKMSVEAGGNVTCGDVRLSVTAKGNVDCGNVHMSVTAGGNVYQK